MTGERIALRLDRDSELMTFYRAMEAELRNIIVDLQGLTEKEQAA